ncbi:MAG: EamA family transporter RarD [Alphaproteobacteria bacterium]|nr:EamA family transporter RarD [Alphaproteobacteria bacterium]MBO6628691.1 EamA family transporter RarD [Alphaproteobacteria bacterium]
MVERSDTPAPEQKIEGPAFGVDDRDALIGGFAAAGGYFFWGLTVIFYKQLTHVLPYEVLAHRTIWSVVLTLALILVFGRWKSLVAALTNTRILLTLFATSLIIGSNWFVFIYSINESRVLETSLGYYINPLISVLIGVVVLSEKLTRAQIAAVALAAAGVGVITFEIGTLPWISLFLAVTFAIYGYLRKVSRVDPLEGLLIEVLMLSPFALAYLWIAEGEGGTAIMHGDLWTLFLLALTGPMTTIPLFLFNYGAQRIRLATLGLMQYFAPSIQLLIAVTMYGEQLTDTHLMTFGLIWAGLALFSWDTWRKEKELRRVAKAV